MPRNMSFAMTTDQVRDRSKTVTRRFGWTFLKPGDEVRAVEKAMGIKKGEKIKPLAMIRVVSIRAEPLNSIKHDDVIREGFPDWTPAQFIQMLIDHYKVAPDTTINRIEFEYLNPTYRE
ncbi:hypothetical protein OAE19_05130 [Porticoccaceae bacterium]|nr:hypothetical protein [Porticoccaceae bacterium]